MTTSGDTTHRVEPTSPGDGPGPSRRLKVAIVVVVALVLGAIGRSLVSGGIENSFLADLLPWLQGTSVHLYFGDAADPYLVPVSRTLTGDDESPEGLLAALLEGPAEGTGLVNLIPDATEVRSVTLDEHVIAVDLSAAYLARSIPLADEAIIQTLTSWPDVEEVRVTVDGIALDVAGGHMLYYYDRARDTLVAEQVEGGTVRDILTAYLDGPGDDRLVGLPDDVEVISLESSPGSKLLRLNLTYSPQVREFATDDGDAMRRVLEGLMATLTTGFPETHFLYLDFEGHASLGLGQCANLLRRVQPPPEVLNDERLMRPPAGA